MAVRQPLFNPPVATSDLTIFVLFIFPRFQYKRSSGSWTAIVKSTSRKIGPYHPSNKIKFSMYVLFSSVCDLVTSCIFVFYFSFCSFLFRFDSHLFSLYTRKINYTPDRCESEDVV